MQTYVKLQLSILRIIFFFECENNRNHKQKLFQNLFNTSSNSFLFNQLIFIIYHKIVFMTADRFNTTPLLYAQALWLNSDGNIVRIECDIQKFHCLCEQWFRPSKHHYIRHNSLLIRCVNLLLLFLFNFVFIFIFSMRLIRWAIRMYEKV